MLFFFGLRQKGKTAFILCVYHRIPICLSVEKEVSGNFTETFRPIGLAFFILTGQYRQNSKGDHLYARRIRRNFYHRHRRRRQTNLELEHLDTIEWNGQTHLAFFPAEQEGEETPEEELGLVILKAIQENGEEILSTLDSDEEMDAVYEEFMKELFAEEDEEDS